MVYHDACLVYHSYIMMVYVCILLSGQVNDRSKHYATFAEII